MITTYALHDACGFRREGEHCQQTRSLKPRHCFSQRDKADEASWEHTKWKDEDEH